MSRENLLRLWYEATPLDLSEGETWYLRGRLTAQNIANRFCTFASDDAVDKVCGVLAALSPSNTWDKNVADAEEFCTVVAAGGTEEMLVDELTHVGSYGRANRRKAYRILKGERPLDVLGGLKVRAFYLCLVDGGETDVVCVDRHAKSAAYGWKLPDTLTIVTKVEYEEIAGWYREVAAEVGLTAAKLQAVLWCVWRRKHNL